VARIEPEGFSKLGRDLSPVHLHNEGAPRRIWKKKPGQPSGPDGGGEGVLGTSSPRTSGEPNPYPSKKGGPVEEERRRHGKV